jgi:prolipoprotein diacylglyceryl transferase
MNSILSFITWDTDPILFELGPIQVRYYGLLWGLSFFVGFYLVKKLFVNEKEDVKLADPLLYAVILGGVLGARLGHVIFYQSELIGQDPLSVLLPFKFYHNELNQVTGELEKIWSPEFSGFSGLASHGGLIGICISLWWYKTKKSTRSYLWILDKVAVPAAIACVFIRVANFINSEIVGKFTGTESGVLFKNYSEKIDGVWVADTLPRHPAQLYEAGFYLIIFGLLWFLYWKKKAYLKEGYIFGVFLSTLFIARFIVEFFKNSQAGIESYFDSTFLSWISTGQILSIPFVILGVVLILKVNKKAKLEA